MKIKTERHRFQGGLDWEIEAKLDYCPDGTWGWGIYAPCFTCGKDILAAARICQGLARHGIGMLRIDFTGLGDSDGSFKETNFSTNVTDLRESVNWMATQDRRPFLMMGHSLGGAAAIVAAQKCPDISAVVTLNAPSDPGHVRLRMQEIEKDFDGKKDVTIELSGRPFTFQKQFFHDLDQQDIPGVLRQLKAGLLILHAPKDQEVGIEHAGSLFEHARHPKSFISLNGADHLVTKKNDAQYVADLVASWARPYH